MPDSAHRDVEALRQALALLLDVPDNAETHEAALNASEALTAFEARLEQVEQERDTLAARLKLRERQLDAEGSVVLGLKYRAQFLERERARVQELEAALREIESTPWYLDTWNVGSTEVRRIARRALAPDTASQEYECEACGEPLTEAEIACYGDGEHRAPDTAEERE